ncbi:MAG: hypothetical protein RL026_2162 [Pseudomonadota bacterium]
MSFRTALSGLNVATTDLSVTANNVANVATTGFKSSRAEFAELFAVSTGSLSEVAVGSGVRIAAVAQDFEQGNLNFTGSTLDLGISGGGFFTVAGPDGTLAYTRAGAFRTDQDGYVTNAQGQRLQVFPPLATGGFNQSALESLRMVAADAAPNATTEAELVLNLPSDATPPANAVFDPADPASYTRSTALTVYDSLGAAHTATTYFSRTATAGTWDVRLYVDGQAVGTPQQLAFTDAGVLGTPAGGTLAFGAYTPATGAAPLDVSFDFSQATQYGSSFGVNSVTQDGYTTGRLIGMEIDRNGIVSARYTNGRALQLGQVALSTFANPNGLQQLADTTWAETYKSGQVVRGQAGSSGFGLVQSGALEASNVDITEQLVNMITAQRNFQANAQMISTSDQITQTIINLR